MALDDSVLSSLRFSCFFAPELVRYMSHKQKLPVVCSSMRDTKPFLLSFSPFLFVVMHPQIYDLDFNEIAISANPQQT
jgi:hypothetical protein